MAFMQPDLSPVLVQIGPVAVRYYGLAYVVGIVAGIWLIRAVLPRSPLVIDAPAIDDVAVFAIVGVVVGGRLGQVLVYEPAYDLAHPAEIVQTWTGGMSFHGGLVPVVLAGLVFCRIRRLDPLAFGDLLVLVAPVGIGLGRLANVINGELWGRVTAVPWAVIFQRAGPEPRHPSQLYEALGEGALLFDLLWLLAVRAGSLRRPQRTCVGRPTLRPLGFLLCRRFLAPNRYPSAKLVRVPDGIVDRSPASRSPRGSGCRCRWPSPVSC